MSTWSYHNILNWLWVSLTAQFVKNPLAIQETPVQFLDWEDPLEKGRLPTLVFVGFHCGSAGKESAGNVGDLGSIPGLGRCPGERKGYSLQYSAWRIPWIVYSVGSQRAGHDWAIFTFSHLHTHPTLWTVAHQTLLYMGFPRQECWSGLPRPPPGDLPDSRIEPVSPEFLALQADSLLLSHQGSPIGYTTIQNKNFKVWGNTNGIMRQDSN